MPSHGESLNGLHSKSKCRSLEGHRGLTASAVTDSGTPDHPASVALDSTLPHFRGLAQVGSPYPRFYGGAGLEQPSATVDHSSTLTHPPCTNSAVLAGGSRGRTA